MSTDNCCICYCEIPAPDLKKAIIFYSRVFKWKIDESDMGGPYAMFNEGGHGGGFDPNKQPSDKGVVLYISVKDIPATLKEIASAGGSVVKEKTEIGGNYGFYGLFKDPNGNQVGVWSKT
jgi:predicted enzyme related to lactoylglutathione lyase